MKKNSYNWMFSLLVIVIACSPLTESKIASDRPLVFEHILIHCSVDCETIASQVQSGGGQVKTRYRNIAAVSAVVPSSQVKILGGQFGRHTIIKDTVVKLVPPKPLHDLPASVTLASAPVATTAALVGDNYNFAYTGAKDVHTQGQVGEGVVVAVIDSGTANNPDVVPALNGSVIGGENLVDAPNEPSATSSLNGDHGTVVASMIAAHTEFVLPNDDELIQALLAHSPDSVRPVDDTHSAVAMIGTAPAAKIYALKTFPAHGDGALRSVVLAAMDRALTLKRNFNNGVPVEHVAGDGSEDHPYVYDSLNIQVVNMSLGGPTHYAGQDLEDMLTLEMLREGMLVVSAAGNEGPGAMTVGSPATSPAGLAVGAASSAVHERILRDLQRGPGTGLLYRPTDYLQTAYFSSRGPNADGSGGPMVMANGVATFGQSTDGTFAFYSGSSFSSPTVAGAAAVLFGAEPQASAAQVRQALIQTANATLIQDGSGYDQGAGVIDLPAALALLKQGDVADTITDIAPVDELIPVRSLLDVTVANLDQTDDIRASFTLKAGETKQLFLYSNEETGSVQINIEQVAAALPPEQQNALFGDDLFVSVINAPTAYNDIVYEDFVFEPTQIEMALPQTGILRVAVVGDWTNAGEVSTSLRIRAGKRRLPAAVLDGKLRDAQTRDAMLQVIPGTKAIDVELGWEGGWSFYPAHDLDLYLVDPEGNLHAEGASLAEPERVHIENPMPGFWTVYIDGYEVHGFRDEFKLRAADQNGRRLKVLR